MNNIDNNFNNSLLFSNLEEYFSKNEWHLNDCTFFTKEDREKKRKDKPIIYFDTCTNLFLANELKGFVRNLIIKAGWKISTVYNAGIFIRLLSVFMEKKFPNCISMADINLEKSIQKFKMYLSENGHATIHISKHITSEVTIAKYKTESSLVRNFRKMYEYISDIVSPNTMTEYEKDTWDIRKLKIQVEISMHQPLYTIPFTGIEQLFFKEACKKFIYYRLQYKAFSTAKDDIKGFNNFSKYLGEANYQIHNLSEIDRHVIEGFIAWISTKGWATKTRNKNLTSIKLLFLTLPLLGMKDISTKKLILNSDFNRNVQKMPEFYSDNELKRLNEHLSETPPQIARMLFVIENVGMRISDLCVTEIKEDSLKKVDNDKYIFKYYQPKTHRNNTVPLNGIVGVTIEEAIRVSKELYGEDCKYVFAASKDRPISANRFRRHIKQIAYNNNLKCDDGMPFNIKTHTFRGTVATQYANLGIDLDIIRLMLGHADVSILRHYIIIHSSTMIECMKPITEMDNKMIASMGNIGLQEELSVGNTEMGLLALPNGSCAKANTTEQCNHANACYTCRMFRPSRCHLDMYKSQLRQTEANIAIAEINGFERMLEMNMTLKKSIEKIIRKYED